MTAGAGFTAFAVCVGLKAVVPGAAVFVPEALPLVVAGGEALVVPAGLKLRVGWVVDGVPVGLNLMVDCYVVGWVLYWVVVCEVVDAGACPVLGVKGLKVVVAGGAVCYGAGGCYYYAGGCY